MTQGGIPPLLSRASHYFQTIFTNASYVLGGLYQDWVLRIVNWSTVAYIIIGLVVVLVPLKLILRARAKQNLRPLNYGIEQVGGGLANIVIGGLGVAWFNLVIGLSPFFVEVPLTFGFVALYFLLILDVFWLKRTFRKAVNLS